jgi:hypothetical protein
MMSLPIFLCASEAGDPVSEATPLRIPAASDQAFCSGPMTPKSTKDSVRGLRSMLLRRIKDPSGLSTRTTNYKIATKRVAHGTLAVYPGEAPQAPSEMGEPGMSEEPSMSENLTATLAGYAASSSPANWMTVQDLNNCNASSQAW